MYGFSSKHCCFFFCLQSGYILYWKPRNCILISSTYATESIKT